MSTIKCPNCGQEIEITAFRSKIPACAYHGDSKPEVYADTAKVIAEHKLCIGVDLAGGDGKLSNEVRKQGYVKNVRLYRRWILAQLFEILDQVHLRHETFAETIRDRGVRYMWKVIDNEVHDMSVIARNGDTAEFDRRLRWWNDSVVKTIGEEYYAILSKEIAKLKTHKCKGREYKSIPGRGMVFCDQLESCVFAPIRKLIHELNYSTVSSDPRRIHDLCVEMHRFKESRCWNIQMPTTFINAFKGNGAYFGLRNLIMFHNCRLPYGACQTGNDEFVKDIDALDDFAEKNRHDGWKLLGLFKETVKLNGINIGRKLREWRSKKDKKD